MTQAHPLFATALLLAGACAGAEMNRNTGEGDDVGASGFESSGDESNDEGPATTDPSSAGDDSTTDDPTDPLEGSATDPSDTAETDPSDSDPSDTNPSDTSETDPSDTDPSDTDPSDTDPSDTDPSDTDPSDTDSTATDPTDASSEGGSTDDGATTDSTDSETQDEIDLSGYIVFQTDSDREFIIPDGTIVPVGGTLVIGRNASPATFQDFWGVNWGADVVYVEGLDMFPTINGAETYTLFDPAENIIDGPTPPLALSTSATRVDASMPGGMADAWETSLVPNDSAVPGVSAATGAISGVPYISEYADPTGAGNFDYEFVEIHVPL